MKFFLHLRLKSIGKIGKFAFYLDFVYEYRNRAASSEDSRRTRLLHEDSPGLNHPGFNKHPVSRIPHPESNFKRRETRDEKRVPSTD
jgi:hypothetical protein